MKTIGWVLKNTGIGINFGTTILLGFVVGMAIAGQTFYLFTVENLRHFGALKAMGASTARLARMILSQAFTVGITGYGVGVGLATAFGLLTAKDGQLSSWRKRRTNPDLTRLRAMELHRMEVLTGASPGSVLCNRNRCEP